MKSAQRYIYILAAMVLAVVLGGCSSSRLVPDGQFLLDKASIRIDSCPDGIERSSLQSYLRQQPNHKMLWATKFRLGIYNMSGRDTTKWWNRWVRRLGEPPVIWDASLTQAGADQLAKVMVNKGYLHPQVLTHLQADTLHKKIKVEYEIRPGQAHTLTDIEYVFPDDSIKNLMESSRKGASLAIGDPLDRTLLEAERDRIVSRLRNHGYWNVGKEFVTFNADTTAGSLDTHLTVTVNPGLNRNDSTPMRIKNYIVRKVVYVADFDPMQASGDRGMNITDTVHYKGIEILYGDKHYLRPSTLYDNCFIVPGEPFRDRDVDRTYKALSRLEILNYVNIRFEDAGLIGDTGILDAYILLTPGKSQSIALEVEGTNSEGDLGVALGASYKHLNVGRGSETLSAKLTGSYESLSGNLDGLIHDRYMEYALDLGVEFPKFKAPFLRDSFKRKINATTDLTMAISYQERPEFTRIVSNAAWAYKWTERRTRNRHTFTLLDINYVYLPESTNDFINEIAPDNPLLRYSYEDHFIMRLGYSFYHTNKRTQSAWRREMQRNIYTIRANVETAGNLLYAINNIFTPHPHPTQNPYKIFGIHYSQYVKGEADFGYLHIFDHRNSLACHAGFGIGYPYGNSSILPFEKRFFGGGANGVRGWAVRTLGPGSYPGSNSVSDFINQCGDIRLDMSVEYRAKLFWVIELGAFVDAGNIWTIHNYPNQPGGMFHFNSFYKEIAAAYGLGLRLDFSYFLLRFDLGMKAHNPARGEEPWPIIHPRWHRDSSFHFSIGYPF